MFAFTLAGALLAGCAHPPPPARPTSSTTTGAVTTSAAPLQTSTSAPTSTLAAVPVNAPLLGSGPVLAAKIDNTSGARPRVGLDSADIVYVEPVEAGLTRLLAIFASSLPPEVGPVRSARESDAVLLGNVGKVAFAFSGASPITTAAIAKGPQVNVSMDSGGLGYRRAGDRPAPYNVFGRSAALLARDGGSVPAGDIGLHTGPTSGGGRPATRLATAYPLARLAFTWDPALGRYLVNTDGRPEVTAGGVRVSAATVLVQMVGTHLSTNQDVNGARTPVLELLGTGAATLLRGGTAIDGTWARASDASPTRLTSASGAELTLAPGPLWVLLVPVGQDVGIS